MSDDDLTASSLQELQKLQKQVQKYPVNNPDSSISRRAASNKNTSKKCSFF
jgi:hypothetical protein